jgi:hypothetical protein
MLPVMNAVNLKLSRNEAAKLLNSLNVTWFKRRPYSSGE